MADMQLTCPVFLVGFMGAGKTSIARKLARMYRVASVDMDTYLERREGRRIRDIFAAEGEDVFRDIETDVLRELAHKDPLLISCGGGVVLRPENRELMNEQGFSVYLHVTADEAASRISDVSSRPLFQDVESARQRCLDRMPLYQDVADACVDTSGRNIISIANEVGQLLEKEGVLCPVRR